MTKALELAKFGRETPPTGVVVGDSDTQTLSSKTFSDMPVFSSGTANTVTYLNASKVLSSSTSLSFDGSNLGIGVASPAATLDVYGGASGRLQIYSSASGNFLTSKVAANTGFQILNYLGSQHVWGDGTNTRMVLDASGNLGINKSSALAAKLDVVGTTNISAKLTVATFGSRVRNLEVYGSDALFDAGDGQFDMIIGDGGFAYMSLTTTDNAAALKIRNHTGNADIATFERTTGNVGIGTASPAQKLEVAGNMYINTSGNPYLQIKTSGAGNNPYIRMQADTNYWDIQSTFSNTNDDLLFQYNGTALLDLDKNGNLGLGVTPAAKLDVYQTSAGTTAAKLVHVNGNAIYINPSYNYYDAYNHIFRSLNGSTNYATIDNLGKFGLGMTPSGSYSLQIYGVGSSAGSARIRLNNSSTGTSDADGGGIAMEGVDLVIQNSENGVCKWEINGSERARITSSGRVGIGTTNPDAALDVRGDIRMYTNGTTGGYGLGAVGTAGGARDIFLAGQSGYSNGFTVKYTGSAMKYAFQDGNVGIGTIEPSTVLTVLTPDGRTNAIDFIGGNSTAGNNGHIGTFANGTYISTNWYYSGAQLKNVAGNGSANILISGGSTDSESYIGFSTGTTAATSPSEKMRITSGGNVGIGTTIPGGKFSVQNGAAYPFTSLDYSSGTSQATLTLTKNTGNAGYAYDYTSALNFASDGGPNGNYAPANKWGIRNYESYSGTRWTNRLDFYNYYLTTPALSLLDDNGNVGIGNTNPEAKLHVSRSSSTAFNAADNSWHSVIVNNQAGGGNNASGICFVVSNNGYFSNAGTGIAAVKNGINSDYGADLVFVTRGQSVVASEKMRILGNGKVNTAGVSVFSTSGYAVLTDTFYIDVPVENDNPGLANTYHIEASISHANWSGYGCLLDTWYNARANVGFFEQYDTRVVTSGNGGSWTVSKPAAGTLRITHNAGTYAAGGYYWIRVTMNA
jgi:hypothetical protein